MNSVVGSTISISDSSVNLSLFVTLRIRFLIGLLVGGNPWATLLRAWMTGRISSLYLLAAALESTATCGTFLAAFLAYCCS